ncbi:MAG: gamma-glutamyl-gamma-aminobutyrate hydrolase family protein [Rhodobacterales bacterium]
MARPVVGIVGNTSLLNDQYPIHAAGTMNTIAVAQVSGCLPLIIPSDPSLVSATEAHGTFDRARDAIALGLVRACVERGQPFFGVCRGFQEVNVAMGGTLYPEIRELPGRMNHRMPPDGTMEQKFELRHDVTFTQGGVFHELLGAPKVRTNTLHGQGIKAAGPRVIIDGFAEDGTPEAIYIKDAPGFTLAVQWHPEWDAGNDPVSRPLFERFGAAAQAWADSKQQRMLKSA